MATNDARKLGYAGAGRIGSTQVLMTSGGINTEYAVPYMTMLSAQPRTSSRSKVKQADGTKVATANLSFDVTSDLLTLLSTSYLLQRGQSFDMTVFDGEAGQKLSGCYLTSLSLSGSPGGLINGSIQATGPAAPVANNGSWASFARDDMVYGYWYSGKTDVRDWTFSMSQDVQPVYTNLNSVWPTYLRVGLVDFSLEVTTYDQLHEYDDIGVVTKKFTLSGNTGSTGYTYGGQTELGTYSHTFETSADMSDGSSGTVLVVS